MGEVDRGGAGGGAGGPQGEVQGTWSPSIPIAAEQRQQPGRADCFDLVLDTAATAPPTPVNKVSFKCLLVHGTLSGPCLVYRLHVPSYTSLAGWQAPPRPPSSKVSLMWVGVWLP